MVRAVFLSLVLFHGRLLDLAPEVSQGKNDGRSNWLWLEVSDP